VTISAHPNLTGPVGTDTDEFLRAWAPVLGPTAVLLAHLLAGDMRSEGEATSYEVNGLAAEIGVAPGKLRSAIARLARNHIASVDGAQVAIRLNVHQPGQSRPAADSLTLSVDEAAELLGISRSAAYAAANDGTIPAVRFGRRILIPRAKLMEMLDQ